MNPFAPATVKLSPLELLVVSRLSQSERQSKSQRRYLSFALAHHTAEAAAAAAASSLLAISALEHFRRPGRSWLELLYNSSGQNCLRRERCKLNQGAKLNEFCRCVCTSQTQACRSLRCNLLCSHRTSGDINKLARF